jgi:hypothetical protein
VPTQDTETAGEFADRPVLRVLTVLIVLAVLPVLPDGLEGWGKKLTLWNL